ncbi:unnamed protein product [Phyllotreta striolata]|uniref:LEM domain-containing protein 2 n=1 Tax=Phyllotreta striolata TaxID=444603 RepID=A0A9P0GNQ4_PHYSR|nr:unnamed protein product [Phyllotreta striolata]
MVLDVEKLSDAELRTKLLEFGFPVMPITGTTRKVMAKKLKMLLENKNKIGSEGGRRSLGRYSSEEESDTEVKVTKKKDNRRITMGAGTLMQPPAVSPKIKKANRFVETPEPEFTVSPVKRDIRTTTSVSTRSQKIVSSTSDDFDTGSDSESDINYLSSKVASDGRGSTSKSSAPSGLYSPPKTLESSYSSTRNISFNTNTSPSRHSTYNSPSLASEYASDRLNQIRSRLSLNSPTYEKSYSAVNQEKVETPFLSNFTKRLSNLSSQRNDYDYKNDIIKEQDVNGSSSYARSQLSSYRTRGREPTYDYRANRNNILKNNFVSFAVLAGAALFFVLLAIMYMGMRSDTSVISSDYIVPQCIINDPTSKKFVNCVPEENVSTALHLLNVIKPELHKRALAHKCFDPTIKPQMTESEIINFCLTNFAIKDHVQIKKDLNNLLIMTFNNPEWGLSVAQTEDNNGAVTEKDLPKNMEQVIFNLETKLTSLVILNPSLPWKCTFFKSFYLVTNSLIFIVIVFGCLYLINLGYKYYKHHAQKEKDEVSFMVEKIVDILQMHANDEQNDNYLVINHIRDMILPVGDRQKKAVTWAKAVKFINENESRIRTEVQEVKGEPFEVWRWIGHTSVSLSGDISEFKYRPGRRIVDPQYLIEETLKFPHRFLRLCKNTDVAIKNEIKEGFVSIFILECKKCKVKQSICSEELESDYLSVNLAFVAGILSLGLSLYTLNELCSSLRIPGVTAEDFSRYVDEIYQIYNDPVSDSEKSSSFQTPAKTSTPIRRTEDVYGLKKNAFLKQLERLPGDVEKMTRNQVNNPVWFEERRKRLTASNFGRICKLLDTTNRKKVVESLLHDTFKGNIYTKWGTDNEPCARSNFEKLLNVVVKDCGLFVHPDYPFLAASPDGLIEPDGLVEIKCPYKAKEVAPDEGIESGLIKYAKLEKGALKLNKEDKYYYQVQGQLFVTGRTYCYFVIWTPKGLLYEKILRDEQLWNKMLPKLEEFYFDHLLPALLKE